MVVGGLGDLVADRKQRIERGHRILQDAGDAPAADLAHIASAEVEEVDAVQLDAAADDARVRRKQPHDRVAGGGLAAAGFADEPTTNLDVTIQLQYLNLLKDLQRATGVALIFVTHNLGIVAKMCDTVAVMYAGRIVERQSVRGLFYAPRHPYTKALLDSIPKLGTKEPLYAVPGQPPDLSNLPSGCSFHPRCTRANAHCREEEPPERKIVGEDGTARCWLAAAAPVPSEAAHV